MINKNITFGSEGRDKVLAGVNIIADAVKATLGPKGRNVLIEQMRGAPRSTKDGVSVAKEIQLKDPEMNAGAQLIREVASKQNEHSGDGTTTATVLAQAIANEGYKSVRMGMNPIGIKRGIDKGVDTVIKYLDDIAVKIESDEQLEHIATISANGDIEIAKLIATAVNKVGKEGVVMVEETKLSETTLDIVDGIKIDRGFMSPYFITNPEKATVEYEDAYVLLTDKRIPSITYLLPLINKIIESKKPLLIVADDIEAETLGMLALNAAKNGIRICAIKAPGFGPTVRDNLTDLSIITGGSIFNDETNLMVEKAELTMLGRASKIKVTKDSTVITNGAGSEDELEQRCVELRGQIKEESDTVDKEDLKERLARLTGGIAVIRVGGNTEVEVKERKDRIDDAVNAAKAALEEGYVIGGGMALFAASLDNLNNIEVSSPEEAAGVGIIRAACQTPVVQIIENAGKEGRLSLPTLMQLVKADQPNLGYNAATDRFGDMVEMGVIDPVKVVKNALKDAASVAGLLLTTEVVITMEREKD